VILQQAAYTVFFYVFAMTAIALALAVVLSRQLLRSAVYLMGVLITSAAFYVMLGSEFLAGIQVLVYVGGITVVIAFAVMLIQPTQLQLDNPAGYRKFVAFLSAAGFAVAGSWAIRASSFGPSPDVPIAADSTRSIGLALLDSGAKGYVLPFEIVSVLLLAAVIGSLVVARKTPPPAQPFTSGGDRAGEADTVMPKSQRPPVARRDMA
jgi:NADH-quinone oxidoreductase subunit J